MKRVEGVVTGRVQAVMFRDFAERKARSLGILGTVQNKDDGSVFIVAEGEEEKLLKYIELLKKGSIFSKVENISIEWLSATAEFKDFRILYK